ncbi:MAG TPA: GspH/FimT family pseudopilin [Steroidobacteraceae bacterium]|nr:GspH/FimT family pseudopilin [Steroidobacteraceae bacterium]
MKNARSCAAGERGFTLFELMIVCSIAAVLAALAVPAMHSFLQNQQQSSAVTNLMSTLQYARSEAIKEDVPVAGANCTGSGVCVCPSANGTTCDPAGNWNNGWIVYTSANGGAALEAVGALQPGLTLSTNPATVAVSYQPNGTTDLNALVEFTLCDSRGAAYARELEVGISGSIQASSTPGYDVTGTTALVCP